MNRCHQFLTLIIIVGICWGCRTNSGVKIKDGDQFQKYVVSPQQTNDEIIKGTDEYYIFTPASPGGRDRLLIFLPGSLVDPKIYQQILATGAENGVYSVGLSYQNNFTLTGKCRNEGPDCEGNLSREELEGKDYSNKVRVSTSSSIEGRIKSLVQYMKQKHPDQNWGAFMDGEQINWGKVIIAGHSQGGSHAAYIGWHRPVARVGMFSAPHNVANAQAEPQVSWLNDNRKTPASEFYGFGNTKDNITKFSLQHGAWSAMGLSEPVISVDTSAAPYQNMHQLSTSTVQKDGLFKGAHGSTCADKTTARDDDGNLIFKPVWKYMLFKP